MKKRIIFFWCFLLYCFGAFAQDSLPSFLVKVLAPNKVQISWQNQYPSCTQLSIQKSYDSLKFFQTIFSSQSPELPQNGYIDNNYLPQIKTWYRIFYVVDTSSFYFTTSKSPFTGKLFVNNTVNKSADVAINILGTNNSILKGIELSKDSIFTSILTNAVVYNKSFAIYLKNKDSLWKVVDEKQFKLLKDSLISKAKDTLFAISNNIFLVKTFNAPPLFKPSSIVFSNTQKSISIILAKPKTNQFKIIFYNEKGDEVFRLNNIKQEKLFLEKSNFVQAGWYSFELFENNKLKEKNKFLVEKDF